MNVALFDYGAGNLHSLGKALERAGASIQVTSDWDRALAMDALVLPGVGAFGAAVNALEDRADEVRAALEGGLPCLGICLGMQLLLERSDESEGRGIGIVEGHVRRIEAAVVPQMGWCDVEVSDDPLFEGTKGLVAYYANSYVCAPADSSTVIAWSTYDEDRYPAAVRVGRTWGVQFHPEKSSRDGLRLIDNFLAEAFR
jgi:glutamine amidotransferase